MRRILSREGSGLRTERVHVAEVRGTWHAEHRKELSAGQGVRGTWHAEHRKELSAGQGVV